MRAAPRVPQVEPAVRISLLHATYHRPGGPTEVMRAWVDNAAHPDRVEYVVAMDTDDTVAVAATEGLRRSIGDSADDVTAVRNWNAAAALATGSLLVVIADDLFPPNRWDETLVRSIGRIDPDEVAFAVKVRDSVEAGDVKLRHPVVSRRFYAEYGLFDPAFTGVYCDDELTARAFWRSFIVDGTGVQLHHRHPTLDADVTGSRSHGRINSTVEYERGRRLYHERWNALRRLPLRRHGRMIGVRETSAHVARRSVLAARGLGLMSALGWASRRALVAARHRVGITSSGRR